LKKVIVLFLTFAYLEEVRDYYRRVDQGDRHEEYDENLEQQNQEPRHSRTAEKYNGEHRFKFSSITSLTVITD
jgi:hypothetical protein